MIGEHPERHLAEVFQGLQAIGYWRPSESQLERKWKLGRSIAHLEALPDPRHFVDLHWPQAERDLVANYLDGGLVLYAYDGWSTCRICGTHAGTECLFDGTFVWPSGFSHYLREHGVKPDPRFIAHVLATQ